MTILELQILSRMAELEEYLVAEPEDWDAAQELHRLTWLIDNAHFTERTIADARRHGSA
jgi:hypothetical protein